MSSATEPVNPPHPGKLELIERVARGIEGPWRFADLGGLWAVHGVYAFHALAQPGCVGGTEVDTHPTRNFLSALADEPLLAYVQGNFGDREVFAKLPHFDVVFLFDTLLHQVSPDWGEILRMYASRASHVVIFNQQYTGEQSIRLLDLGEDAYFSNVPHDRNHPTYADLFRKLDEKHPAHDRNWRDVHHIWQWGITNNDLIARMAELGFEQTFHRDWGQVLDLARFENHAFIFSRIASRPISTAGADDAVTVGPTEAETEGHEDTALPDQLPALAAIEDDGTLVARPVGEQLRLMRAFRRSLRPGGELRIAAVGAQAHVLIERARYAGFTTATPHADTLVLHTADRRMVEGELPLVTIAIPAFKPGHFAACLESALAQTYPRLQILVSDDSGNDLLRQIASRLATADRIEWIRNPATLGGRANFIQCIERARGDFIKFLCDDDVLEPDCVERMVEAFRSDPQATLVFSRRQRIDGDGKALSDDHHTEALAEQDCVFRGEALAGAVIALQSNFIGEPSTVMFRRADIAWIRPHYAAFDGHDDIRVVGDIAAWHNLLSQGDAVYIARPLSRFRIHAGQSQARAEVRELIASSWQKLAHGSHSLGFAHDPHPLVPHRKPGTTEWHIDPTLPLNRRLAARAHHTAATPAEPLAATVLRLVETALAPTAECAPAPLRSDDYPRYEAAAELLAAGHRVDGAEALIALATEGTPVWEVYADLAEIALAQGERDAALELMQAATERAPDSARAVLGTATLQAEGGNFEGALSTLSPFLRKHPHDTGALTLVRGILGAASELSAVAWARLLADLRYEAATLRAELSSRDFALETLRAAAASALSAAQDMLTTEVTPAPGVASKGAAASELPTQALSNEPEALPDLQAPALAEDRRQLEVARALIASDKLAAATDILSALVLAGTPLADAYHDLGCIAVRQSDAETAISLFGMALERDPKSVSARRNLALTQGIEQRFEDALATLSPILRSGSVSNDDYGLVRDILGKAPALGPIAWARLLSDLRTPLPEQKRAIDQCESLRQQLAALNTENGSLRARIAELSRQDTAVPAHPESALRNPVQASMASATNTAASSYAKLLFVHVPKTAGVSFFSALESAFGKQNCLRFERGGKGDLALYDGLSEELLHRLTVLGGHLLLPQFKMRDISDRNIITLVREPVDRALSAYYYIRGKQDHPLRDTLGSMSLSEYIDYMGESKAQGNNQCWYLCGEGDFEQARTTLENEYFLFAAIEQLPEFCSLLSKRLNLPQLTLPFKNKTATRKFADDIEPPLIEKLQLMTADDQKLYRWVTKRFEEVWLRSGLA